MLGCSFLSTPTEMGHLFHLTHEYLLICHSWHKHLYRSLNVSTPSHIFIHAYCCTDVFSCRAPFSAAACSEDTFTICLMFFPHLGEHPERGKKWWSMPTINPSSEEILTFLSRSWLGSPGASSPISNGLRNFCTKVGLIWKAWNASWNRNVSKCEIQD